MTAERQQQIEPLLQKWDQIRCNNNRASSASIPVMALRAVVASNAEPSQYLPWLTKPQTNKQRERDWLCCWRAEGAGDRLSAHSRSVPLTLVRHFYKHLQGLHPLSCIVDITKWKDWESRQLRAMGVKVLDPRKGTLLELVQLCRVSRVVTIDTALVHLCAAAGQRADLLLNAFPDERWRELTQAGEPLRPTDQTVALFSVRLLVSRYGLTNQLVDFRRLNTWEGNVVAEKAMKTCSPVLNLKPGGLSHDRLEQAKGFRDSKGGSTFQWRHPRAITVLPMRLQGPMMQLGTTQYKTS